MNHKTDASISNQTEETAKYFKKKKKERQKFASIAQYKSGKAKGDSGQFQFQLNDVTSEFLPELMGRSGSKEFSKMAKSDGVVGGILSAYKSLILSCNWTIMEHEDETPEEKKVRETLNDWFFKKNNFEPQLNTILRMLDMGFSCFNKYYTPYKKDNETFMMPVLLERIQKSIHRIDYDKELVEQITSKGNTEEINFTDLVFFTFRQEGNDLRGVSLLRNAYQDYKDKSDVRAMSKKGIFRQMLGMPVGTVPKGVRMDSPEFQAFEELLESISSRDYSDLDDSLVKPEGWLLEFLTGDFKINDIKEHLAYYDSQMAISVLVQFILLGQTGKGGSHSLGEDQSDFFLKGLQFIVDYIESQFTKEIIQPAVRSNWENVDPERFSLRGLGLDKKASKEFATILKTLIDSGILKTQTDDEVLIRKMYDLKPINEKERAERDAKAEEIAKGNPPKSDDPEDDSEEQEGEDEPSNENEENEETTENSAQFKEVDIVEFWSTPKQRDKYLEDQITDLTKYSKASLQLIGDKLIASMRYSMKKNPKNPTKGLKDIKLNTNLVGSYKKTMGQKLSAVILKSWENAERKSLPHLKKLDAATNPSDLPTKTLTSFAINQNDLALEKQLADMKDTVLLTANTASTKGYGLEQSLAQANETLDNFIDNGNQAELANFTTTSQAMSYGEMAYYKSIEEYLWGYRFENVSPKTNICQSCVGKTYRDGSSAMTEMSPPLHFRCKSYYEPIYKDLEKPKYDDYIPSPSIMKEKTM